MELLLLGVVGQVVALRVLAIQLARSPDDPPVLPRRDRPLDDRDRRRRRHQRLLRTAIGGFVAATLLSAAGVVLLLW